MLSIALVGYIIRLCGVNNDALPNVDFSSHWGLNNFNDVAFYGLLSNDASVKKGSDFGQLILDVLIQSRFLCGHLLDDLRQPL
jgi:hypothetical protein